MKYLRFLLLIVLVTASFQSLALESFYKLNWLSSGSPVASYIQHSNDLEHLYEQNQFQLVWYQKEAVESLETLLALMHYSQLSPYFSNRYQVLLQLRNESKLFEYDLLATDTFISYQKYTLAAVKQGLKWFFGGTISEKEIFSLPLDISIMAEQIKNDSLAAYLDTLSASGNVHQLAELLGGFQAEKPSNLVVMRSGTVLKRGDYMPSKQDVIGRIRLVGLDVTNVDAINRYYDNNLYFLVKKFQRMHGLKDDGVIGADTLYWLNYPVGKRLQVLALNIERGRLYKVDKQNSIVVNLPAFKLDYWLQGKEAFSTKVVVGRKQRKTPLLQVKMDTLIFNPTWNVPSKIAKEDIIPAIKRDPNYIGKHNFKIVEYWGADTEIPANSIDWNEIRAEDFTYKFIQAPGNRNALGYYKFNTPNPRAIYLHDTPSKYLFDKQSRAFSSGCVRVQHADKFAALLLQTQQIEAPKRSDLKDKVNVKIPLKKKIPVLFTYQTAWLEDGLIQYRNDIYGYDNYGYDSYAYDNSEESYLLTKK